MGQSEDMRHHSFKSIATSVDVLYSGRQSSYARAREGWNFVDPTEWCSPLARLLVLLAPDFHGTGRR